MSRSSALLAAREVFPSSLSFRRSEYLSEKKAVSDPEKKADIKSKTIKIAIDNHDSDSKSLDSSFYFGQKHEPVMNHRFFGCYIV